MHVSVLGNPDDSVVVTVRGDLDIDSATVLTTTLDQVLERPVPRVVVDLSGVAFCDSTALSAFVVGHNRAAAAGGWLRLAAPTEMDVPVTGHGRTQQAAGHLPRRGRRAGRPP